MTTKIGWNEFNRFPHDTFLWKGIDGTEVLTHLISTRNYQKPGDLKMVGNHSTTYNGLQNASQLMGTWQRYQDKDVSTEVLTCYGYGDGGGGPTEEMLDEFSFYLGSEKAEEIVITNTNMIADMCDRIAPVRPDKCPPVIENSDQQLTDICYRKAHEMYGEELPEIVEARLKRELTSIISYIDLLKKMDLNDEASSYVKILDKKAQKQ